MILEPEFKVVWLVGHQYNADYLVRTKSLAIQISMENQREVIYRASTRISPNQPGISTIENTFLV